MRSREAHALFYTPHFLSSAEGSLLCTVLSFSKFDNSLGNHFRAEHSRRCPFLHLHTISLFGSTINSTFPSQGRNTFPEVGEWSSVNGFIILVNMANLSFYTLPFCISTEKLDRMCVSPQACRLLGICIFADLIEFALCVLFPIAHHDSEITVPMRICVPQRRCLAANA